MSKEVRIIKRYQNRKLYDTFQSCYVTLEEISQIIREGNEIQVIDNKTKNDITYMTQIQLLFDQERKSVNGGDTELLKRVIRGPEGTLTGYIKLLENGQSPTDIEAMEIPAQKNLDEVTPLQSVETPSLEIGEQTHSASAASADSYGHFTQNAEINTTTVETSNTIN